MSVCLQSIPRSEKTVECKICGCRTNTTLQVHEFLTHHEHAMAYVCRYCTYSDLVTDRFAAHVQQRHGGSPINPDDFFRYVEPFGELQMCPYHDCEFVTNSLPRLNVHLRVHTAERCAKAQPIRVEDLSDALGASLVVSQRRDMEEQSLRRKVEEREQGLPSPPLVLHVNLDKPMQPVRPKTSTAKHVKRPSSSVALGTDDERQAAQRPRGRPRRSMVETPASTPVSRRAESVRRIPRSTPDVLHSCRRERRSTSPLTEMRVLQLVRNLPRPPMIWRPMFLPMERVVQMCPTMRYFAEMDHRSRAMFLCFRELPQPMAGAITRPTGSSGTQPPVVSGVMVMLHSGAPDAHSLGQSFFSKWKLVGALVDTRTKPWTTLRKIQLTSTVPEGEFMLVDPGRLLFIDVEVVFLK